MFYQVKIDPARVAIQLASSGAGASRPTTDVVEVNIYGFPAWANKSAAAAGDDATSFTFAEAEQRPIYTAYNHRKVDVGNPEFGHVCAVFMPQCHPVSTYYRTQSALKLKFAY